MFKSIAIVCITALVVDTIKTIQHRNQLQSLVKTAKPVTRPVRKNDDELKLWHLSSASNKIARREFHGDYIGLPDDQKVVDLDFELIIASNR